MALSGLSTAPAQATLSVGRVVTHTPPTVMTPSTTDWSEPASGRGARRVPHVRHSRFLGRLLRGWRLRRHHELESLEGAPQLTSTWSRSTSPNCPASTWAFLRASTSTSSTRSLVRILDRSGASASEVASSGRLRRRPARLRSRFKPDFWLPQLGNVNPDGGPRLRLRLGVGDRRW